MAGKKGASGGARAGAGRPGQDKVRISLTISKDIVERLDKEPNRSATTEVALRYYFEREDKKPP